MNTETWTVKEIVAALAEGKRPFIPGGYHTKEDRAALSAAASDLAGYAIKTTYSGEQSHRYFFVKA